MTFCCWSVGNLYVRSGKAHLLKTSGQISPSVEMTTGLVCCCYVSGWRSRCGAASCQPQGTNICQIRKKKKRDFIFCPAHCDTMITQQPDISYLSFLVGVSSFSFFKSFKRASAFSFSLFSFSFSRSSFSFSFS